MKSFLNSTNNLIVFSSFSHTTIVNNVTPHGDGEFSLYYEIKPADYHFFISKALPARLAFCI